MDVRSATFSANGALWLFKKPDSWRTRGMAGVLVVVAAVAGLAGSHRGTKFRWC